MAIVLQQDRREYSRASESNASASTADQEVPSPDGEHEDFQPFPSTRWICGDAEPCATDAAAVSDAANAVTSATSFEAGSGTDTSIT